MCTRLTVRDQTTKLPTIYVVEKPRPIPEDWYAAFSDTTPACPKRARAVADVMSRVQIDDGARKAKAASHFGPAAEANPIRELVV
jgi:hypothetical protein